MASNFSGKLQTTFTSNYTNSNAISTPSDAPSLTSLTNFTNGAAANQATKLAYGQLAFTATQTQTIDLSNLSDPFGVAFSLVTVGVKGLLFINLTTTAGAWFTFTPSASNGWVVTASGTSYGVFANGSHKVYLGAGGTLALGAPQDSFAVPDSSHCKIDIYSQLAATLNYAIWG